MWQPRLPVHSHALGAYWTGNPSPTVADVQELAHSSTEGYDLTDAMFQSGIIFLEHLLATR